ncbi:MAG TPA: 2Fe-2S iron-sulfur cluster binding domain-containing protein, partial [Alicyclobacillus sp.]|nr:2Fe-2S iron-sulfur cluster binding domain-containing protein [Alicyclobacillus sp.]
MAERADGITREVSGVVVHVNGEVRRGRLDRTVLEVLLEQGEEIPHVCYHPSLGPIQTCDTCLVEIDGELVRSCGVKVTEGMRIDTRSERVRLARLEAMDRILMNHELYCTVCDNNNGNCVVHNTVKQLGVQHQREPFSPKPYEVDASNP